jgi:hypothetical protein
LRDQRRSRIGTPYAIAEIDKARDNSSLIADLMQVSEPAADVLVGNLADQRQHRGVHRIGGEQSRAGVEQPRSRNDRIGLRLVGRQRRAERHIGCTLFVAGMNHPDRVRGLEQRVEQVVIVHAGQGVHRIDPVGDQGGDGSFCRRQGLRLGGARLSHCGAECADRGRSVERHCGARPWLS